ncbi:tyrosine-type recombinase/integrase [Gracilibacillus thailandensis]|uniref:tyrosine-type recombinase/integrase n=2 Tax=Bacillati TaxID=1783272 RepID=UPI003635E58E
MPRNSHQDALDDTKYRRLIEATDGLDEPFQTEAFAILVFGGRLGMRGGEICHLSEDWVNWERKMIEIPAYDACACGYCRQQAHLATQHDDELTIENAMAERWQPKTEHSIRTIPFDFDEEVEAAVEIFFDRFDGYEHSRASVNRRVDRVAEEAGIDPASIYPHALRATAATNLAYAGVPAPALQSMMGWSKLSTATKYIRLSGTATADALNAAFD